MAPEKILITSQKLMGDLIVQTAAYAAIRRALPAAHIVVLCDQRYTAALSTNTDIDEIWAVPFTDSKRASGLKNIWNRTRMLLFWARKIRAFGFTRVLVTDYSDKACIWAFVSGAKIRGGLKHQSLSRLLTHTLAEKEGARDFLDFYLNLAALIAPITRLRDTVFPIPRNAPKLAELLPDISRSFIVIHPGASAERKRWSARNWAQLIEKIAAKSRTEKFVLVSGPNESHLCEAIFDAISAKKNRSRTVIFAEHPLLETAVVMKQAKLVFCLDSASRHLAAALGTPSICLMTKWIQPTWGLYAPGQHQYVVTADATPGDYDISSISVDEVVALYQRRSKNL